MPRRNGPNRTPDQILRDARAVELRRRDLTYDQIAGELGLSSKSSAYVAVQRGLADAIFEAADEVRQMEVDRIDELARKTRTIIFGVHYRSSGKDLIPDPEAEGRYLMDPVPVLKAIDTYTRLMERKARLLGLDATQKIEVITPNMIDEEIARLSAELSRRADHG